MTEYIGPLVVGDWIKLIDTTENDIVVYAKIVEILPKSSRGIIIEYMEQRFNMTPEFLEKVTDAEMMLWKLEHADDKKKDEHGIQLKIGDWVRYSSSGMTYVGRVTTLRMNRSFYDNFTPEQVSDDIEITQENGNRNIRSSFYVRKITEDEAMLFMLEC